ncbi:MAG: hypothetical protein FJY85_04825, partial [Deltaproteobacteria bacterium]|nr:hypothetical protein [Deltaproteobacteria bacterium]
MPAVVLESSRRSLIRLIALAALVSTCLVGASRCCAVEAFDLISGVVDSPEFKGKDPLSKLRLAADLLRSNRVKQSDMAFVLLDWGDQYLREPSDLLERLKRWSNLAHDKELSHLKIPRDFLNRILLAEYLVTKTPYLTVEPRQRLEIIRSLEQKNLVDWSVALAYSRLYAGALISGAKAYEKRTPLQTLLTLKTLEDEGLVGWHYRVPTEAIIVAEVLAQQKENQKATPLDQLVILRDLEQKGLINNITRKDLEKLPAWRLLIND